MLKFLLVFLFILHIHTESENNFKMRFASKQRLYDEQHAGPTVYHNSLPSNKGQLNLANPVTRSAMQFYFDGRRNLERKMVLENINNHESSIFKNEVAANSKLRSPSGHLQSKKSIKPTSVYRLKQQNLQDEEWIPSVPNKSKLLKLISSTRPEPIKIQSTMSKQRISVKDQAKKSKLVNVNIQSRPTEKVIKESPFNSIESALEEGKGEEQSKNYEDSFVISKFKSDSRLDTRKGCPQNPKKGSTLIKPPEVLFNVEQGEGGVSLIFSLINLNTLKPRPRNNFSDNKLVKKVMTQDPQIYPKKCSASLKTVKHTSTTKKSTVTTGRPKQKTKSVSSTASVRVPQRQNCQHSSPSFTVQPWPELAARRTRPQISHTTPRVIQISTPNLARVEIIMGTNTFSSSLCSSGGNGQNVNASVQAPSQRTSGQGSSPFLPKTDSNLGPPTSNDGGGLIGKKGLLAQLVTSKIEGGIRTPPAQVTTTSKNTDKAETRTNSGSLLDTLVSLSKRSTAQVTTASKNTDKAETLKNSGLLLDTLVSLSKTSTAQVNTASKNTDKAETLTNSGSLLVTLVSLSKRSTALVTTASKNTDKAETLTNSGSSLVTLVSLSKNSTQPPLSGTPVLARDNNTAKSTEKSDFTSVSTVRNTLAVSSNEVTPKTDTSTTNLNITYEPTKILNYRTITDKTRLLSTERALNTALNNETSQSMKSSSTSQEDKPLSYKTLESVVPSTPRLNSNQVTSVTVETDLNITYKSFGLKPLDDRGFIVPNPNKAYPINTASSSSTALINEITEPKKSSSIPEEIKTHAKINGTYSSNGGIQNAFITVSAENCSNSYSSCLSTDLSSQETSTQSIPGGKKTVCIDINHSDPVLDPMILSAKKQNLNVARYGTVIDETTNSLLPICVNENDLLLTEKSSSTFGQTEHTAQSEPPEEDCEILNFSPPPAEVFSHKPEFIETLFNDQANAVSAFGMCLGSQGELSTTTNTGLSQNQTSYLEENVISGNQPAKGVKQSLEGTTEMTPSTECATELVGSPQDAIAAQTNGQSNVNDQLCLVSTTEVNTNAIQSAESNQDILLGYLSSTSKNAESISEGPIEAHFSASMVNVSMCLGEFGRLFSKLVTKKCE